MNLSHPREPVVKAFVAQEESTDLQGKKVYRDVSRHFHVHSAAEQFCRLAAMNAAKKNRKVTYRVREIIGIEI